MFARALTRITGHLQSTAGGALLPVRVAACSASSDATQDCKPLKGLRVLELGQLIAGPFVGTFLGYFGAEVIKIEPPNGGDPIRTWRHLDSTGTSLWWRSISRNKKSVTLDLRQESGRAILAELANQSDVLIENFRPGRMEQWGLGPADLAHSNPGLVYCRISGYGQTGPDSAKPGYASVCEALGGLRFVNGFPGGPPVRANLSLGDTLAGLHGLIGVLIALLSGGGRRGSETLATGPPRGQVVDVAIFESVFNMLESVIPEYDRLGVIRQPSGSTITGVVPSNTYLCADKRWVVIGGNGDSIFKRLMTAVGRDDMASDKRLETNVGRVKYEPEIDDALATWTASNSSAEVLSALEAAQVPCGPLYSVKEMFEDKHFHARGLFENVLVNGEPLVIP
eukprot:gene28852-35832_t